ncbi:MAG: HD domain-containing protein [Firmicutes bacterium]|nr:HD domain-containing protein [Bacillota bacterium]
MQIVSIDELEPGMVLGKTIIGNQGQVLLRQGVTLTAGYIEYLKKYPFAAVYISTGRDVVAEDIISDETRLQAIAGTREVLSQVKGGADLEIKKVNEVLIKVIDELLLQDNVMINLVDLRSFDEELFSHSVNVAILSVLLGIEYDYPRSDLRMLALAALLHDIGYLFVPEDQARQHVEAGVEFLGKSSVEPAVLKPVLHHHERWDGAGYPGRVEQTEINEFARIIHVANVFDRLSANNRYPMEEVIEYLMGKSGEIFDPECIRRFIKCVSFYPVGTPVELNTGESGVVVGSNKGFPTRPVVRIEQNMYGHKVEPGYTVDLLQKMTYFVKRKLDGPSI